MSIINFNPEVIRDFFGAELFLLSFKTDPAVRCIFFRQGFSPRKKKDAASIGAKNQNRFPLSKVLIRANYY